MNKDRWGVMGLLLVSWGLLCWQLGQRSLWVDEFSTVNMTRAGLAQVIQLTAADLHPPLYFLAVYGWRNLVGASDLAVRWPSIAASLLAVALMAALARRWLGRRALWPAAFLLGLHPALVEFGRMARYYSFALMLGLLSTWLLLRAIKSFAWRAWGTYALASLALLYSFYPSGILIAAQGLWMPPPTYRGALRRWLVSLGGIALLFGPWLAANLTRQLGKATAFVPADFAHSGSGWALGLASTVYTFSIGQTLFPWRPLAWVGLLACVGLLISGALSAQSRVYWLSAGMIALSGGVVSLIAIFVSIGTSFLNVPARALFALPYFLLLLVAGWVNLPSGWTRRLMGGALSVAWGASLFNYFTGQEFLNPSYLTPTKEAAAFIRQNAALNDLVVSDADTLFPHYFLAEGQPTGFAYASELMTIQAALAERRPARVWLVVVGRDRTRDAAHTDAVRRLLLARGYRLTQAERYLPIDPTYRQIKDFLLKRNSYAYRLEIEVYSASAN